MAKNYMEDLNAIYNSAAGQNMYRTPQYYQPSAGESGGAKLGKAIGGMLGSGGGDSSRAGSRGAYNAGRERFGGPTQGAMPADAASAAAAGAGSYQAGRAVAGPQGYDGGQMVRPIDRQNPFTRAPSQLTPDDRKFMSEVDTEADRYISELAPRKPLTGKDKRLSDDIEKGSSDYLARMNALYSSGRQGG